MLELKAKLEEPYGHQLNLLNLYGLAASAFRSGRDSPAPSARETEIGLKRGRFQFGLGRVINLIIEEAKPAGDRVT